MSVLPTESLQGNTVPSVMRRVAQMIRAYVVLTKLRIMTLLVFTAYCAAIVAQHGIPRFDATVGLIVGLGLSAGGAAAINMWYDRDIDSVMSRTKNRPIVSGQITANAALTFGVALGVLSFIVFYAFVNPLSAILSVLGYLYYAVVYTMWLKRRTPQNIVVGGGAGAFPPLIGWSAVTGHVSLAAITMFAIIFFWTPSHFWSLALFKNQDYVRAHVPMMPVVRGPRVTKIQCLVYTTVLLAVSLLLYATTALSVVYLIGALLLGLFFLLGNIRLWLEADDQFVWAKRNFFFSLMYLPLVFIFMVVGSVF